MVTLTQMRASLGSLIGALGPRYVCMKASSDAFVLIVPLGWADVPPSMTGDLRLRGGGFELRPDCAADIDGMGAARVEGAARHHLSHAGRVAGRGRDVAARPEPRRRPDQ